jgi:AbrB family looped-hinge helix DNA binding protein
MTEGLVSTKGQVVIPKSLREAFGIMPGSRIRFANENGQLVGHVVSTTEVPSIDVLLAQARKLSPPDVIDFGPLVGGETIDDNWAPPPNAFEIDLDELVALWNQSARAAVSA